MILRCRRAAAIIGEAKRRRRPCGRMRPPVASGRGLCLTSLEGGASTANEHWGVAMGAVKLLRGAGVAVCLASGPLLGAATGASGAVLPAGTVTLFSLPKEPEGVPHFGTSHITAGPDGK